MINAITLLSRRIDQVKFDPILLINLTLALYNITVLWVRSPSLFSGTEGKFIPFMLCFLTCLLYVLCIEFILPSTNLLESSRIIDLRKIYFDQKNMFYISSIGFGLIYLILEIFYPEVNAIALHVESKSLKISLMVVMVGVFSVILIFWNNYYFHLINTLFFALNEINEAVSFATTMKYLDFSWDVYGWL